MRKISDVRFVKNKIHDEKNSCKSSRQEKRHTMKLIFIRHGQTQGNAEGRYLGKTDEPLCPEGIEYIKKKNVKSVNICGIDDLSFLSECQSIERLTLTLIVELDRYDTLIKKRESEFYIWYDKVYDYQQIYDLLNLKKLAIDDAGARDQYMQINSKLKIDLCRFPYLRVYYGKYKFTKSLDTKVNMQTLGLSDYGRENIIEFSRMAELDTLSLTHSKIKNLKGCEFFPKLQCVYLGFNRTLTDISDLKYAKNTLRMLEIDHCGHIEDFSVLNELENLEFLRLLGTNTITDIQFIKKLPKLKTFICDYKVKDGDVHPCGLINGYVYIQNRKNFNTKEYGDDNYPRTIPSKEEGIYVGQENIELWRRLWSSPQWPEEM